MKSHYALLVVLKKYYSIVIPYLISFRQVEETVCNEARSRTLRPMYEETGGGIVSLLESAGFIKNRRKGGKQSLRGLARSYWPRRSR